MDTRIDEFLSVYGREVARILAGRQVYSSDSSKKWLKEIKQAALQTTSNKFPNLKTCIDARREQIGYMTKTKNYAVEMSEAESVGQTILSKIGAFWYEVYAKDYDEIMQENVYEVYKKICDEYEAVPPDAMIAMLSDFDEDEIAESRNRLSEIGYGFSQAGNLSTSETEGSFWFIVTKRPTEKDVKIAQLASILGVTIEKAKLAYDLINC